MKRKIISFVGAPASGKGYLVDCIVDELVALYNYKKEDIQIISIGGMIRKEINSGSKLGEIIKASKKPGCLAPDELITAMMNAQLNKNNSKITLIDGYPRTIKQLESFNELVKNNDVNVIFRDTPQDLIVNRAKNRRICANCGTSHIASEGACHCGGNLVKRKEDENIEERIKEYNQETLPAIKIMSKKGLLYRIDGKIDGKIAAKNVLKNIINNKCLDTKKLFTHS